MAYPSTFQTIQNAVINKLRLDSTNDLDKVKDWINQAYADACLQTEANITSSTMALTASTSSYSLPTGVLRIKEMVVTPVGSTVTGPLQQTTLDDILNRRRADGGTVGGSVSRYALLGLTEFEVWPTPSAADVITIYYVAAPTALSANGDFPILPEPFASKALEYGALADGADFSGDPAGQEYRALYEQQIAKLRAHLTRARGGQPGQFRIWNDQTWPPHDPSTDTGFLY